MAFQGILCFAPVLRAGAVPRRPLPVFFWPGIFCTQNFVCKAWAESPPMGGDLSAGRRVPVPMRGRWRMKHPSPPNPANQTTGATRAEGRGRSTRRGKRSAHANGGRTTAHARRPRTQPRRGPRPQLSRPASGRTGAQLFFSPLTEIDRIAARQRHGEKRGVVRGEKNTAGAAAKNAPAEPTPDQTPEQPPATAPGGAPRARNRTGSRTTARRGDAKQSAASGQAAQADDGKDGQRAREPPNTAPRPRRNATTPADGETAARRTATAQAGRKQDARAKPPPRHQRRKTPEQNATARARPTRRPRTTAATGGSTHARRAGAPCANAQTASEQRAQRANARKAGGRAKARTRPPREAAGAAARPPPSQTPRAARTQRAARPIVARRCGHFRAGGMRETLPSAFPLPSLARFTGMGGMIEPLEQKNAQKGEKTRI